MGYIQGEFNDWEQEKMKMAFEFMEELLDPKRLKPPKKNPESGKWHFYMKSSDHDTQKY